MGTIRNNLNNFVAVVSQKIPEGFHVATLKMASGDLVDEVASEGEVFLNHLRRYSYCT